MRDSLLKCLALLALICCAASSGTCAWFLWRAHPSTPAPLSKWQVDSLCAEWVATRFDWIRGRPSTDAGSDIERESAMLYTTESERILRNAKEDCVLLERAWNREDDTSDIVARLHGHRREWENTRRRPQR